MSWADITAEIKPSALEKVNEGSHPPAEGRPGNTVYQ